MSADNEISPAQRLRALELSGDPDAQRIARQYKSGPLGSTAPMRDLARRVLHPPPALRWNYNQVSEADADEAEAKVAAAQAQREKERLEREKQQHAFAEAGDRREASMLRLTWISVIIASISFLVSAAALYVAISSA